jgi:hypothetical protein
VTPSTVSGWAFPKNNIKRHPKARRLDVPLDITYTRKDFDFCVNFSTEMCSVHKSLDGCGSRCFSANSHLWVRSVCNFVAEVRSSESAFLGVIYKLKYIKDWAALPHNTGNKIEQPLQKTVSDCGLSV